MRKRFPIRLVAIGLAVIALPASAAGPHKGPVQLADALQQFVKLRYGHEVVTQPASSAQYENAQTFTGGFVCSVLPNGSFERCDPISRLDVSFSYELAPFTNYDGTGQVITINEYIVHLVLYEQLVERTVVIVQPTTFV